MKKIQLALLVALLTLFSCKKSSDSNSDTILPPSQVCNVNTVGTAFYQFSPVDNKVLQVNPGGHSSAFGTINYKYQSNNIVQTILTYSFNTPITTVNTFNLDVAGRIIKYKEYNLKYNSDGYLIEVIGTYNSGTYTTKTTYTYSNSNLIKIERFRNAVKILSLILTYSNELSTNVVGLENPLYHFGLEDLDYLKDNVLIPFLGKGSKNLLNKLTVENSTSSSIFSYQKDDKGKLTKISYSDYNSKKLIEYVITYKCETI